MFGLVPYVSKDSFLVESQEYKRIQDSIRGGICS